MKLVSTDSSNDGGLLPISTLAKEGAYLSSRWMKLSALLEEEELASLFALFSQPLFQAERPGTEEEIILSHEDYLTNYRQLLLKLREKGSLTREDLKTLPTVLISEEPKDSLYLIQVKERFLVKPKRPVLVLQPHFFAYEGRFLTQSLGEKNFFWGIQFSYPQLYQDPKTQLVEKVDPESLEGKLFAKIRQKLRSISYIPTFSYRGEKLKAPFRLGFMCEPWINTISSLQERGFKVEERDRV